MEREFDPTNTSVEEVHEILCDKAVEIANDLIAQDRRVPRRYKGPVFRNGAPYNDGRLVLEITEEYQGVPEKVKAIYREHGHKGVRSSITQHGELFVGMVFGEARAGRNYFNIWQQSPTTLF